MKTKILLVFCCLLSITTFSQDSIFQLKNYQYRTKGFRTLEFRTAFSGYTNNSKQSTFPTQSERLFDLSPSYFGYTNVFSTDKRLHSSSINFSPAFRSDVGKNGSNKRTGKNYQAILRWSFEDRFYKKNNWFWLLSNTIYAKQDHSKRHTNQYDSKTTLPGADEYLTIGFGKGRLEMVQDAQMALFILNDLKEQGLINTIPSAETVNEFAELITEINNRRVLDSRKKRIYELTQIDKFLREKDITPNTDIRHFTVINDNWALAFNPYRLSGSSWSFNLTSSARVGKAKQTTTQPNEKITTDNEYKSYGTGPAITYENHKPINLKWQRDIGTSLTWRKGKSEENGKYISNTGTSENQLKTKEERAGIYAYYGIGFYPNNRTMLNARINLDAFKLKDKSTQSNTQSSLRPSFTFITDYFLSYRTRLAADASISYSYDHYQITSTPSYTSNQFHTSFSVTLSHYFL